MMVTTIDGNLLVVNAARNDAVPGTTMSAHHRRVVSPGISVGISTFSSNGGLVLAREGVGCGRFLISDRLTTWAADCNRRNLRDRSHMPAKSVKYVPSQATTCNSPGIEIPRPRLARTQSRANIGTDHDAVIATVEPVESAITGEIHHLASLDIPFSRSAAVNFSNVR